jgi:tetratricopeptide (TPR) repeat protein
MTVVVKAQPENPTFLFRLGRFLQQSGMLEEAYDYFQRAKAGDSSFVDPQLSLASTAIDLGRLNEAQAEIDSLRTRVTLDKKFVLDEIEAKYHLALDELDVAAEHAKRALDYHRNSFTLSLMAKVEGAKSTRAAASGMTVMAESHRNTAIALVKEGIEQEPKNPVLINQLKSLTPGGR